MENSLKLEAIVEWMRLHGVKGYTEMPSGGFSLELFEDQISHNYADSDQSHGNPYVDPDLFPDGKIPRIQRLKHE